MGDYQSFSGTIKQGDFRIGYRVISEYLWYSERGILLIWLGAIGYALCSSRARPVSRRLGIWLTGAGIMVGGLLLFSDVVPQFMVYGRLARGVVPFLCLGAGTGMACFLEARPDSGERVGPRLVAFIALLAAFNFSTPLFQVFPETFNERAVGVIAQQQQNI